MAHLISAECAQTGPILSGPGASRSDITEFSLPKLTRSQKEAVQRAKKYAMEQSIKTVLLKQTIAHQHQQMLNVQQSIQRQQALALMCRVYVGTINFAIKEDTVKQAFLPFGPIKSISLPYDSVLKKHKGFAFIEYDIPEAASLALEQMNGVMICGFSIKVGRPSNMPQAQPIIERIMEEAKAYNRIYVASIHSDLSESDIRSVFEAFGKIVSCKLASEPMRPQKHKGYGYIEFDTPEAVTEAVASMNLFDLGGQYLRVGKCVTPPNVLQASITPSALPTASAIAAAAITAKLGAVEPIPAPVVPVLPIVRPGITSVSLINPLTLQSTAQPSVIIPQLGTVPVAVAAQQGIVLGGVPGVIVPQSSTVPPVPAVSSGNTTQQATATDSTPEIDLSQSLEHQESLVIKGPQARNMVTQKLMRKNQSKVMVLTNMVGPDDVDEELEQEINDECSKYGATNRIVLYNERQVTDGENDASEVIVKIFVEFTNESDADKAVLALNGRYFGGRSIIAKLYDQDLFDANNLSG